jgi:hypothetical protein
MSLILSSIILSSVSFVDVGTDYIYYPHIKFLDVHGYLSAKYDGDLNNGQLILSNEFKPNSYLKKGDALIMLFESAGLRHLPLKYIEVDNYVDVNNNSFYAHYIYNAKHLGLLSSNKSFYPSNNITFQYLFNWIVGFFGIEDYDYVAIRKIMKGVCRFDSWGDDVKRGEFAAIIAEVLWYLFLEDID